jgi:hypothetical protein
MTTGERITRAASFIPALSVASFTGEVLLKATGAGKHPQQGETFLMPTVDITYL